MCVKLVTETYTKDFEIDVSKLEGCKGVYSVEVLVPSYSQPLVRTNSLANFHIREDLSPFKIVSPKPITNAVLVFEFEQKDGATKKIAEVRYLYHE